MSAFVIVELSVNDPDTYERYKELATASVAASGGAYRVRGGKIELVEGEAVTDRFVVLEFPDMDAARDWYNSPEYQAALPLRRASADTKHLFFVEGYDPD
jgi:uncharacterized protein (DUF1330 family)